MDKSLEELKRVAKLIDEKKIQKGKNEPIQEIKNIRTRKDSLMTHLKELESEEKEMQLKLKILKKQEDLVKIQERLNIIDEENKFYTDKPDKKGYVHLRVEKWEREFEDLILKLREIEIAEQAQTIDEETAKEAKEKLTDEIKRLVSIKNKTKARNNLNKIRRGFQKVTGGIATFSNEMSKFSNEMSKFGDSVGGYGKGNDNYNSTDWEKFFDDKPRSSTVTKRRRKSKKSKSTKKSKTTKKRKKRRKRSKSQSQPQRSGGMFDGF